MDRYSRLVTNLLMTTVFVSISGLFVLIVWV